MIADGRIEYKCSACDSRHSPNASTRVRTAAAKVARVLRVGLIAYKTSRAVCINAKTTRNNYERISVLVALIGEHRCRVGGGQIHDSQLTSLFS
jgi:hypothetical protein